MPRLVIFDDSLRGIDLPPQPFIIGRSKRSDVPIHDRLLSRKHCAIVPTGAAGFRLVDLKSSHGTFLNGERVGRRELAYDDVIEIGSTVMVYLDTEAWNRGEGLARLRNPVKAQELVQRLKLHSNGQDRIPVKRPGRGERSKKRRAIMDMLPVLMDVDEVEGDVRENLLDLLVDYSVFKTVSHWVKSRPKIKHALTKSIENALLRSEPGNWEDFRNELRGYVRRELIDRGKPAADLDSVADSARDGESSMPDTKHDERSVEEPAT